MTHWWTETHYEIRKIRWLAGDLQTAAKILDNQGVGSQRFTSALRQLGKDINTAINVFNKTNA